MWKFILLASDTPSWKGHVMHRTCIYIWYTKKVEGRRSPDCPCCYATIEEGREDFRPCYFSGPDDGSSRLEALCPQDTLLSFNSDTRQALQLSAMLMKLKRKLSAPDQSKYESMVGDIKRGLDPTTWPDDEFDEGYETLKEMVKHVGQMWAVEGTQVSRVRLNAVERLSQCDTQPTRPPSRTCGTSTKSGRASANLSNGLVGTNPNTSEYETTAKISGSSGQKQSAKIKYKPARRSRK